LTESASGIVLQSVSNLPAYIPVDITTLIVFSKSMVSPFKTVVEK